jgi:hypothetical protein
MTHRLSHPRLDSCTHIRNPTLKREPVSMANVPSFPMHLARRVVKTLKLVHVFTSDLASSLRLRIMNNCLSPLVLEWNFANEAGSGKILRIAPPAWCGYVSPGTAFTIVSTLISPQHVVRQKKPQKKPQEYITTDNVMTLNKRLAVLLVENRFSIDADVCSIHMHSGCFFSLLFSFVAHALAFVND